MGPCYPGSGYPGQYAPETEDHHDAGESGGGGWVVRSASFLPIPEILRVRRVSGASVAALRVTTEGEGHRRVAGASRAGLTFDTYGAGVQRRSGGRAAALVIGVRGGGVADDVEALLTLYAAAITPTVRSTY